MPFVMHFEYPNITGEQYEATVEKVELESDSPEGMLFHVAGPMEGGWQVIDVWESEGAWHRFRDEKLKPHRWETKDPDSVWPVHTVWGNDLWLHKIPHGQ